MASTFFGTEEITAEDRAYRGSRFSEVRDALFANPYQAVWGRPGEPPLPRYDVTLGSVLRGILPFGKPYLFRKITERLVDSGADLRWGSDGKGARRLLHPNGIGLTGTWEISEESGYTGCFARGTRALLVGRYSTCCGETRRGRVRSLSLVGKLYPTSDPNHAEPLRTANFITQEDLGGERSEAINDAELRNAPDVTAFRRGSGTPAFLISGAVFGSVDREPTVRQLYPIAELGKDAGVATRAPEFIRLRVAPEQPRIPGAGLDFRDEVMAQIYDPGNPAPRRRLVFSIEVTDEGSKGGSPIRQRRTFRDWRRLGRIVFDAAVASYNVDFVLHFNHPTWRKDRNDPSTATRVDGRKVR
jgi:hypothetical protein